MNDTLDNTTEYENPKPGAEGQAHGTAREGNCLLLTLGTGSMLVPRNLVAEVVRYSFLRFSQHPLSGLEVFDWRGRQVPHLRSSVLGESAEPNINDDTKVAVFHGLRNRELLPFYGFTICGSPALLRVSEGELLQIDAEAAHPGELMRVAFDQREAYIPKVDYFENGLIELLKQHTDGKRQ